MGRRHELQPAVINGVELDEKVHHSVTQTLFEAAHKISDRIPRPHVDSQQHHLVFETPKHQREQHALDYDREHPMPENGQVVFDRPRLTPATK